MLLVEMLFVELNKFYLDYHLLLWISYHKFLLILLWTIISSIVSGPETSRLSIGSLLIVSDCRHKAPNLACSSRCSWIKQFVSNQCDVERRSRSSFVSALQLYRINIHVFLLLSLVFFTRLSTLCSVKKCLVRLKCFKPNFKLRRCVT